MINNMSVEFIKQNLWIVYLVLAILGAIGGIIYLKKFWAEKISPRLHKWYEAIKSKMPKLVRREELETIKDEIEKLKNERKEIRNEIKKLITDIEAKFRPKVKDFSPEEKQRLSISCNPEFGFTFSPCFNFKFEIDNSFNQSFLLDRIL